DQRAAGRGTRVASRRIHRRAARDRLQRRVPARRGGERGRRRDPPRAHQPAAPGAAQGGRRGLSLPPDAHPAQRVGMPATGQARRAAAPGRPSGGGAWWARSLEVADLRPWRRARIELPQGLVVVSGPNGAGKTSLVEAIVLGTLGVSPRTARESEAV